MYIQALLSSALTLFTSGFLHLYDWISPFLVLGYSGVFSSLFIFHGNFVSKQCDPDQTPRFAASELGLNCLHMSEKFVTENVWIEKR